MWTQKNLQLKPSPRGFHLITTRIVQAVPEMNSIKIGLLHLFLKHTSASLALNENADPDVRVDLESAMNRIVPESTKFQHSCEGPDDMPAHVKASLLGNSLTIPIRDGGPDLGTWQGIYLCEHRNQATAREIVITIHGE